jgi:GH15 family glucan-1,4-alpha-glucosidase
MDVYSSAQRLSRPFVFTDANRGAALPIGAHGIIGDGFTCALVRVDGAIDWLCLPRFDSPSVFGSLLDLRRGGYTAITPAGRPFESLQSYDPDTNVLETLFRIPNQGVIRLTDYMPWSNDPRSSIHEVHRRVQCPEGDVELEVVFDPRFEYGLHRARIEFEENGVLATGPGGDRLVAIVGTSGHWERRPEGGAVQRFRLRAGQRAWMVLSWDAPRPEPLSAYRPYEHLRATRQHWREWAVRVQYDGPWRHHVVRSALALKLLIYAPSGAVVAAPTSSLPEWTGGRRNWDYRYAWTRDAALAIRAANRLGYQTEARDFFHFVRDALRDSTGLRVMYAIDGAEVPAERILEHLSGYRDSRPVRLGNGAREQTELYTAGALVDAAFLYERFRGSLTLRVWRHLTGVIEQVRNRWREPDHGIWEPRGPVRHNVHSKLMSWVALDRGQRLAPLFGGVPHLPGWHRASSELREDLLKNGLDSRGKHFVSAYGGTSPDASLLMFPMHGFLPADDPRVLATIEWIRSELGTGPFLHRYLTNDGVGGEEGAFVLCGFWLAEALAMAGRLDEAQEVFAAHVDASNHLGLLAEELDPATGEQLGNFPQAFSHLGLINAATRIDRGLRLRDEGTGKVPRFLLDH